MLPFLSSAIRVSVVAIAITAASRSPGQVRAFHLTDGKVINGELSSATDREVVISPVPMKRTTRLPLSKLTPADQADVAAWRQARSAMGKVPFQIRIWMKKIGEAELKEPSVIIGFQAKDGRFFGGRRASGPDELDVFGPFPGEIVNEQWEVSLGVTHRHGAPLGPFEIEGEIWHGELMKMWVKKQDIKAQLPSMQPNKEVVVPFPAIALAKARASSGSKKKDEIEHVNLRLKVNGLVAAELVTNAIGRANDK